MRGLSVLAIAFLSIGATSPNPAGQKIKLLAPAECDGITRRPDGSFFIKGEVTLGGITVSQTNVERGSYISDGVDGYDVIEISCFGGKQK